jgi:hypothetical protein
VVLENTMVNKDKQVVHRVALANTMITPAKRRNLLPVKVAMLEHTKLK